MSKPVEEVNKLEEFLKRLAKKSPGSGASMVEAIKSDIEEGRTSVGPDLMSMLKKPSK